MDENPKLKMLLFFNSLRENMNNFDEENFKREGRRYVEDGYFYAIDKMNHFIQEFINKEIDNDTTRLL
jgi:predicted NAD-dependent protein-ADP-ribosyltransferase YbiA (DUF1768 family)